MREPPAPTLVTLVRHGETSANVEGIWHGSLDTALTPRGRSQAARVAEHLARTRPDATALYASPLARARDTAAPIAKRLRLAPRYEQDLREYHLGDWEGRSYAELMREHRLFERMRDEPDWQPGGGESARQVAERLGARIASIAAQHAGERVIVVTHGGALALALGWLIDREVSAWRRVMSNCAVSDLAFDPEPSLVCFNEVAHLEDLA
jgi:alpha-ribazole phosphatase/probable phosphoglycerate mutase